MANEIGLEIRVAHYPPYTSKYNPIEHRLFPHITRACHGAIFTSIELVKSLIEKTSTKTGLSVIVNLMDKVYAKGRKVADGFKENLPIVTRLKQEYGDAGEPVLSIDTKKKNI